MCSWVALRFSLLFRQVAQQVVHVESERCVQFVAAEAITAELSASWFAEVDWRDV